MKQCATVIVQQSCNLCDIFFLTTYKIPRLPVTFLFPYGNADCEDSTKTISAWLNDMNLDSHYNTVVCQFVWLWIWLCLDCQ